MKALIRPAQLHGRIKTVASKSQAHRMLICAAFADKATDIVCEELSLDIRATAGCLSAMGADISYNEDKKSFRVIPVDRKSFGDTHKQITIDVGESGSTLRFLLPVVAALGVDTHIVMHGRLADRPLSPLWEELEAHGAVLTKNDDSTMDVSGRLRGSEYTQASDVSSQFISGLLFAAPLIAEKEADFKLKLTGQIESINYILMTFDALKSFGVGVKRDNDILSIARKAEYVSPGELTVEGDWSNGAFWICASAMTSDKLDVTGLNYDSMQGDKAVIELRDRITAKRNGNDPCIIDAKNVPDLVPVLSVLAAFAKGETIFTHAERLRIKESDRIKSTVRMLKALGADAEETADGLKVSSDGRKLKGGTVDSCNDHRIAMSAAVASIICENEVEVLTAEAVRKSYPAFWEDFARLGGMVEIVD